MKFYTLKQIFNLIILLCSPAEPWWVGVAWGRGRTHQHATRLPVGREGYNTHSALPMRAAPSSTPPPPLQVAAGRDNKARACPARKPVKYFSFRQLPLPRPASLLHHSSSRAPALLIAKNHFSSVQLSSSFSSCVFSFSIFLYFFHSLRKCFSSPGCTCCAGSSFVAGFSFRRKFA